MMPISLMLRSMADERLCSFDICSVFSIRFGICEELIEVCCFHYCLQETRKTTQGLVHSLVLFHLLDSTSWAPLN